MHTEVEPGSPAFPARPSMASRVALAAIVATFSLAGEGSWRVALGGGLRDLSALFEALLFFVAPFLGAALGCAVVRDGGFFRPGFVGLTAFLGLIAGIWLGGEIDDSAPSLLGYLPHLGGALGGALYGTLWPRDRPRRTNGRGGVLLVLVAIVLALLLLPVLLRL